MQHDNYINIIKKLAQTHDLQVLETKRQATENLPDSFADLLIPLFQIIANSKETLLREAGSENGPLVIGDMQFASDCTIGNEEEACFTLLYHVKDCAKPSDKYLIINFTTGEIMNDYRYYDLLGFGDESASMTYGYLPKPDLIKAWSECKDESFTDRFKSPHTNFIVDYPLDSYGVRFFDNNRGAEEGRGYICISPNRG